MDIKLFDTLMAFLKDFLKMLICRFQNACKITMRTKSKLKGEHYLSMFGGGIIRERTIIGIYIVTCPGL